MIESGILGFARGLLASRRQYRQTAVIVGGENVLRMAAGAVVLSATTTTAWYAASLLAGVFVVAVFPRSVVPTPTGSGAVGSPLAALSGIAGGTLIGQMLLMGPPLVLAVLGGAPRTITAMFTTAAVFRVPYLIALGLALRVMSDLAAMAARAPRRLRSIVHQGMGAAFGLAAVAGLAGATLGPPIIRSVFGPGTALAPAPTGMLAAGSVLALASLGLTLVVIAEGTTRWIAASWIAAAAAFAVMVAVPSTPTVAVAAAFLVAEGVAVVLLTASSSLELGRDAGGAAS